MFEQASIQKIRFPSIRGELNVEQLWDLPLTSKTGFDLNTVAKEVNKELKSVIEDEDSFVSVKDNPAKGKLELKLEIAKHIIAVKLAAIEEKKKEAAKASERVMLLDLLAQRQTQALQSLDEAEIKKRLAELG